MIMMKHNLAVASGIVTRIFSYGCPDISQLFRISNLFKMCKNVDGRINCLPKINKDAVFPKLTHRSIEILNQNFSFRNKYMQEARLWMRKMEGRDAKFSPNKQCFLMQTQPRRSTGQCFWVQFFQLNLMTSSSTRMILSCQVDQIFLDSWFNQ